MKEINNQCKQCQEGLEKYGNKSFDDIYMEYINKNNDFSIPEAMKEIIPFVVYQQHRKYCQFDD